MPQTVVVTLLVLAAIAAAAAAYQHRQRGRQGARLSDMSSAGIQLRISERISEGDGMALRDAHASDAAGTRLLSASGGGSFLLMLQRWWSSRRASTSVGAGNSAAAKQRMLEQACQQAVALQTPTEADVATLEAAIAVAEAAGVDEFALSSAMRRLKELDGTVHRTKQAQATGKLGKDLAAIEEIVSAAATAKANDHGALALLLHVYSRHPPKRPTVTLEALREIGREEPQKQLDKKKKALLKAQRDYHPDRNQGKVRETLDLDPEEWEVLCLSICQQLALAYDRLYKGERGLDASGKA
jgi:hypothetical protein